MDKSNSNSAASVKVMLKAAFVMCQSCLWLASEIIIGSIVKCPLCGESLDRKVILKSDLTLISECNQKDII